MAAIMSSELTSRQQAVYDMRHPPDGSKRKTFKEIGAAIGVSIQTATEYYRVGVQKKAGIVQDSPSAIATTLADMRSENKMEPERAAKFMDVMTDPFKRLVQAGRECGMKETVIVALAKRMRTRYLGVTEQMRAIKTQDMIHKIDERIGHALTYVDDYVMSEANFRDLSMGIGILIEKRQLLKGEPTQIISIEERKRLDELLPMLVKEAARRGITIDGKVERIVEPESDI
jgi:hypothetical protein